MFVKYTGNEDFRVLSLGDVRPELDDAGEIVEEEPWEYIWVAADGHVLEVDDSHAEKILEIQSFVEANEEEAQKAEEVAAAKAEDKRNALYREARAKVNANATPIIDESESSVEPEDSQDALDSDDSDDSSLDES
jgi:hypothetical protein